jgi:N-acyl-D-amino-acid deacylase
MANWRAGIGAAGVVILAALGGVAGSAPQRAAVAPDARTAAARSLALVERGAERFVRTQDCFSCHHQALPLMALALARRKGLPVSETAITRQQEFTVGAFTPAIPEIRRGLGIQGSNTSAGYALAAFRALGRPRDELTDALGEFLAGRQLKDGHWYPSADRPPFEASEFTTTALAVEGLNAYAPAARAAAWEGRRQEAAAWLRRERPSDTEDRVFQLRGLAAAGDLKGAAAAVAALRREQRPDGGWAQTARLRSDAYATGAALLALVEAGGVPAQDPAYQRGVKFLIQSQAADGSWRVTTRAKPQQLFFDNGDPYGRSQFISFAATNLAAMAILHRLPDASASAP